MHDHKLGTFVVGLMLGELPNQKGLAKCLANATYSR